MIVLLIIYIIGVLLVGGVAVWYIKETDEDVTLLDVVKLVFLTFISWLAVLLFALIVIGDCIDKYLGRIIIKKGHKEDEE